MEAKTVLIYFTVIWGVMEIVSFCGAVFGWASLVYVYKELGYFSELCQNNSDLHNTDLHNTSLALNSSGCRQHCPAQDNHFSLIFTIAVVFTGAMCFINGFMYDQLGTRVCRLYATIVALCGYVFLIMASKEVPYLLYPGLILMTYGTYILLLTNLQLGNLIPQFRSTVLTLYCGSYDCGAVILLLFKVAHERGFSISNCFIVQACCFTLTIIATFTIMPKHKYYSPDDFTFHLTLLNLCRRKRTENHNENCHNDILDRSASDKRLKQIQQTFDPYELTRSREAMTAINHVPSISSLYHLKVNELKQHVSMSQLNSISHSPIVRQTSSVDDIPKSSTRPIELKHLLKNQSRPSKQDNNQKDEADCGISRGIPKLDSKMSICETSVDDSDGTSTKPREGAHRTTFMQNLISPMFIWTLMWISLHRLRSWFFIAAFNPWISHLTDHVCSEISFYTSVFATLQFFGIFTAPLSGRLMDRESPVKYANDRYERLHSSVLTFVITCSIGVLLSIMSTIPVIQVQPLTFALHCIHRSFVYGPTSAFVAIAFPFEHFGKLLGLCLTVSAIFALLQYPFIILIQEPLRGDPLVVNILLITAMCASYMLPFYIWRYVRGKRLKTMGGKQEEGTVPLRGDGVLRKTSS